MLAAPLPGLMIVAHDGLRSHDEPAGADPWRARKRMSSSMECESPDSAEPTRKMTMELEELLTSPKRSPSLPRRRRQMVEAEQVAA